MWLDELIRLVKTVDGTKPSAKEIILSGFGVGRILISQLGS